ncbi:MAG: minor capsid protein [Nanoarchaeota archaeon]|nr:minor capsid protein [Nanoarchaeota archaeon]
MISPHLESLVAEADMLRGDQLKLDGWGENATQIINDMQIKVNQTLKGFRDVAGNIGQRTANWHDKEWRKFLKSTVGVPLLPREFWLGDMVSSFTEQNSALIKNAAQSVHDDIQGIVQRGVASGARHEKIRGQIFGTKLKRGIFRKLITRVKLIARDQVSKLNGDLNQQRQNDLGVRRYRWRTSRDERVRENHVVKEGNIYSWDKPPPDTGHPSEDPQCRCYAEAVISDIVGEEFAEPKELEKGWKKRALADIKAKRKK